MDDLILSGASCGLAVRVLLEADKVSVLEQNWVRMELGGRQAGGNRPTQQVNGRTGAQTQKLIASTATGS